MATTPLVNWCSRFEAALLPFAEHEERYAALLEEAREPIRLLQKAPVESVRPEGLIFRLAILIEKYVSIQEDDPSLIVLLQTLFYELPDCVPALNRSFFELEIYPLLSIMTIYE